MIGILLAILFAALAYFICLALHLPYVVALVAALLVLLVGVAERGRFL